MAATSDRAHRSFHAYVVSHELKVPEWRGLARLMDEDRAMVTRLAHQSLFEQSHLTKIIQHIEKKGLLERRSDTEDARRVRMFLCPKGREIAAHLIEIAKAKEAKTLSNLEQSNHQPHKNLLKTMLTRLDAKTVQPKLKAE